MTTVQIIGIAVAAVIVLLLVTALLVTRQRGAREDTDATGAEEQSSFLDAPVTDTLSGLGEAEHAPPQSPGPADAELPDLGPPAADAAPPAMSPTVVGQDLELDWGPNEEPAETAATGEIPPPPVSDEVQITGEVPPPTDDETTSGASPVEADLAAPAPAPRMVALSDVIITTSDRLVDLEDLEVRRMLADLVAFEIDQATQYRQQGQLIDAVLQLTEAEKICVALGLSDTAERIRQMMANLKD
jgi:hypothetical protein